MGQISYEVYQSIGEHYSQMLREKKKGKFAIRRTIIATYGQEGVLFFKWHEMFMEDREYIFFANRYASLKQKHPWKGVGAKLELEKQFGKARVRKFMNRYKRLSGAKW